MKTKLFCLVCVALLVMVMVSSCTSSVQRLSSDVEIDLTGEWNDTDVSIVCSSLLDDCLSSPRLAKFESENGRLPYIVVGNFRNDSEEHIDTSIITSKMQKAIIDSGKADFIVDIKRRQETRSEIMDQQAWSNYDSAKSVANEEAADYMLQGSVKSIVQKNGKKTVRTYFVYCELVDIESAVIVWTGENSEIKKVFTQASVRW